MTKTERKAEFKRLQEELTSLGMVFKTYAPKGWNYAWQAVKSVDAVPGFADGYGTQYRLYDKGKQIASFGFMATKHGASCAIPVLQNFLVPSSAPVEAIAALLKIAQLRESTQGYLQAITLSTKDYVGLNKALRLAGFKKIATVPTRHDGGYDNFVWQWKSKT